MRLGINRETTGMFKTLMLATALTVAVASGAQAACAFRNETPIRMLAASFPAWKAATDAMAECGNFQAELDLQFRDKQPAAMAAQPARYHIAGLAVNSLVPLLDQGTVRPLDDLVAKYGKDLQPNQLIRIDGKVMAIAILVNAQHLMYRDDIYKQLGLSEPKTYDELLTQLERIKTSGLVQYPLGGTYRAGWDLATEFVNLYFGYGGTFIGAGNVPTVNNASGQRTLEMMKKLTAYMDPEYLASDAPYVAKQFQQGKIAVSNLWATRAGAMDDPKESTVVGKVVMAAAPAAVPGGKPATTIWWDGFAVAKNISDAEAEAAFRVALEGIDGEMVRANNDLAVWLSKDYKPGPAARGAAASAEGGATPYPATTAMGLMQTALAQNLPGFFTGAQTAEQTLARIEAAYTTAARERGLLR